MTFQKILDKFRKYAISERDKGDKFEILMQVYLQTDPKYATLFSTVWLWNEFPFRKDFGGKDTGVDLVARTYNGDYWAIQCKCYAEEATIDKPAVDSFLSTSSRSFIDDNGKTVIFAHRLWISTTNHWGTNAEEAIRNQQPAVSRIGLYHLENAPVDWAKLEQGLSGDSSRLIKKKLFPHQETALSQAHNYFKDFDRGKLIMACGTGKTFTSLKIAENETNNKGFILFLVPSIALLGQTLDEWYAEANEPIHAICICSDSEVSKKKTKNEDIDGYSTVDLALPASTDVASIVSQLKSSSEKNRGMTVVFSTYQSIEVISKAQKAYKKVVGDKAVFDLIVCDEAHRTTGVTLAKEDESAFVKVHDNNFIQAKKRLYMTATPRLYDDNSKSKAAQGDAILCSMDDASIYGEEVYRIGFGEAVNKGMLSDYKVLILTVSENDMPVAVQKMVANPENEISSDDISKLIGCINALSKQILGDADIIKDSDPEPMKRAVAFCPNILASKKITSTFNSTLEAYYSELSEEQKDKMVAVCSDHIDGTMSATTRQEKLSWLKSTPEDDKECRVLTNVRCLSEGVDVPSLDAVLFLSARNSQVDVVQSVGRVMRKSPGKKYGYIIIPVVVPADIEPEKALNDNERYAVVWTVLNALRAHDDRFDATVNKLELNRKKPEQIVVGRPDYGGSSREGYSSEKSSELNRQLTIQFEQLQNVLFARMVQKVGDKRYWEQWAKDVAQIAERHMERINKLIEQEGEHRRAFDEFISGLRKNINPAITVSEGVEMLSQHIITKPVFEALFEDYSFVKNNPISQSMQRMIDLLKSETPEQDSETLQKFYDSVCTRAEKIDNAEGKQRVIIELYDKFFKTAFPKMVEKLGIVYTPVEVVDFIVRSVDFVLRKEFERSLSDENVHILDPFTGTGTFITRLLQSGLIAPDDMERKFTKEIHANEIVLLAYYIAAVNIENAFHDLLNDKNQYMPFEGICLTDTFQLGESDASEKLFSEMFPQNSQRVIEQKKAPLRVIIGNPPYSIGQKSANDNAQNQSYTKLDAKIANTYAATSSAGLNKSLYDAYIKAFRWSTDRLDPENGGVIAFVSNGAWLDGNSTDGFRKCLEKDFSSIYVFNLRGNQRTSGELSRQEGGKIFGSGSRTPIAITLLIKKPKADKTPAVIHYHDIGDYLNREEKLSIIHKFGSIENIEWQKLKPNEHGDWLNQRNDIFGEFIPLAPEKKFDALSKSVFNTYAIGLASNRDAWVYNFSKREIEQNMQRMIEFYNKQLNDYKAAKEVNNKLQVEDFINTDATKISWTVNLKKDIDKLVSIDFGIEVLKSTYRPFCKQNIFFDEHFIERPGLSRKLFPYSGVENKVICISCISANNGLSVLITDSIPDIHFNGDTQCFPMYHYEERRTENRTLFDDINDVAENNFVRRDAISDFILERTRKAYGSRVSKEDIFYYVYGILHSPEYRTAFAADLKKMLPRIPLVDEARDFWNFSKAGRDLAELHLNYETPQKPIGVIVNIAPGSDINYLVEKMRFSSKENKSRIIYNSQISIENIPAEAYEYVVNGKSAIEWVMERYAITTHKESGISNNPNDWATEQDKPRYILDLLLSVIKLSIETVEIVNGLPNMKF
ncbi:MAG: type ISP restriction/modification enzyme [Odoribacter sp.]